MKKILIIEDDEAIARIEQDFLSINGFESEICENGSEAIDKVLSNRFDLIILDLMLPGLDGIELIKMVRDKVSIPIIMVTAKGEEVDKLRGLGLGADDYIAKPFSPSELVARVKANLAQYERLTKLNDEKKEPEAVITIDNIKVNPQTMKVYVNSQEINLKHREFELLLFLMDNLEHVFSKEELYERIWGMESVGDIRTVAVHINRLREKIEKDPANPEHIVTVWGAGYRFEAKKA